MTVKRRLPTKFNHLLTENSHSKDDLVDLRRLGQTKLMSSKGAAAAAPGGSPQMTLFSYVHLRAPLPQDINPEIFGNGTKPEAYFLMRRSKDGFVSSTGMFKASFPWATKAEEDLERRYVKSHFDASAEETAGNLWVHPDDALSLSADYHCRVWIEALVDDRKVNIDPRNKAVTPPPAYKATEASPELLDPVAKPKSTAGSPARKIAQPRKSRAAKAAAAKEASDTLANEITKDEADANGMTPAATSTTTTTTTTTVTKTEDVAEEDADDLVHPSDSVSNTVVKTELTDGDSKTTVEVEQTTETNGDVVIESTHVKVELPAGVDVQSETPEEMIAKAKEMVAEALKETSETTSNKKRKIDEGDEIPDIKSLEIDSSPRSKRARVLDVITEEKFQRRALFSIGATVAIGGLAFFSNLL